MKKNADRKNYTDEFKEQAIELARKIGTAETARKLDIPLSNLQRWRSKLSASSSSSPASVKLQKEIKRLKKEVEHKDMIIDMLKKTTAYFSKETFK